MTEHKTHQLTVLVEPSLREAIDKARGNLTMGRFVRDAIAEKIAEPNLLGAVRLFLHAELGHGWEYLSKNSYERKAVDAARAAIARVMGDQDADWEVRS